MATAMEREGEGAHGGTGPAPASEPKVPGRRKRLVPIILAVLVLGLAAFGVRYWLFTRTHVTTDDAQVDGHITPVLARVGGFVSQVRVEDNQSVKAGDTLVVLDDRDLSAKLAQQDAELMALLASAGTKGKAGEADAQLQAARAGAAAAAAAVTQARANAQKASSDLQRYRTLAEKNIVSRQQLDAAEAASEAANAQLVSVRRNAQAARQQVVAALAGLDAADAKVAAARAARDQVALQLSYTRITAPQAGVVAKKSVEIGQYVQPGQPLMSVVPLSDVWVEANLKETQVQNVRPGEPVDFSVDAYSGITYHGTVESLSPATGAKFSLLPPDNATGNFTKVVQRIPVRIRVAQDPKHPLRPGMSAEVTITTR